MNRARLALGAIAVLAVSTLGVAGIATAPPAAAASTCAGFIPAAIVTQTDLATAIAQAESANCPGPDTIDLGGNTITMTSAVGSQYFTSSTDLTIMNGKLLGDGVFDARFFTVESGTLTLSRMLLQGARSATAGGGVYVATGAFLVVEDSALKYNSAVGGGGGVYSVGTTTIVRSSIVGNTTPNAGGGIFSIGSLVVSNSTISSNVSPVGGSGLGYSGGTGATVTNTTIADNRESAGVEVFAGTLTLANSIIAHSYTFPAEDCIRDSGATVVFSPLLSNIIENGSGCGTPGTDFMAVDPDIVGISSNLSNIHTYYVSLGAARDAGDNASTGGATLDQVGQVRIWGGAVDLGSIEQHNLDQTRVIQLNPATTSAPENLNAGPSFVVRTTDGEPTESTIQFSFAVSGGTAQADDYEVQGLGVVTVPAGLADGTVLPLTPAFRVIGDDVIEPDETVELTLTGASGASLGIQTTATHTIVNDDVAKLAATGFAPIPLAIGAGALLALGLAFGLTGMATARRRAS